MKTEKLIPWHDAPKHFPGTPVSIATLNRWRRHGIRGRKLESVLIGGRRYITLHQIAEFCRQQDEAETETVPCA